MVEVQIPRLSWLLPARGSMSIIDDGKEEGNEEGEGEGEDGGGGEGEEGEEGEGEKKEEAVVRKVEVRLPPPR